MKIKLIARTEFTMGGVPYAPPPEGTKNPERYAFEMTAEVAVALVQGGMARPAYRQDFNRLSKMGMRKVSPFMDSPSGSNTPPEAPSAPESAPETSGGSDSTDLEALVLEALEDGKKATLVHALESIGLDPGDYTNNSDRKDALDEWLGNQ
jgi:hypothetical protein